MDTSPTLRADCDDVHALELGINPDQRGLRPRVACTAPYLLRGRLVHRLLCARE
jgi:hypothetical protein